MKKFVEMGIIDPILKSIEEMGYDEPTPIQEETIPLTLEGTDVIAVSATGSGKTFAFSTSIIQHLEPGHGVQAIILTPTRELAEQVSHAIVEFSKYKRFRVLAVYGGVSITPQIKSLKDADIVVATPGRMLDHISRRTIGLRNVKKVVLDEADRMLDMGFIDDVKEILGYCPEDRHTMLFSATMSEDIYFLAENFMRDPVKVSVDQQVDPRKLKQIYYDVPMNMKLSFLVQLLKDHQKGLAMVFCNTQRMTDFVVKTLNMNQIDAIAIHGGLTQAKRTKTLDSFHDKKAQVLVCTDVAARGLHIDGVTSIYNFDIPRESKQYIHRIGRTARAGEEGIAINLLSNNDHDNFSRVLHENGVDVQKMETPKIERIPVARMQQDRRRGGFNKGRPQRRTNNSGRNRRR